jgi:hypothetical protein
LEPGDELARLRQEKIVVFIGCGKKKTWHRTKAKYLYQGRYFRLCLSLARKLTTEDRIFILSAKYGLLLLDREIEPYNQKLTEMSAPDREKWRGKVKIQTKRLPAGKRVFLCSRQYTKGLSGIHLLPCVGIGLQMQWMERALKALS